MTVTELKNQGRADKFRLFTYSGKEFLSERQLESFVLTGYRKLSVDRVYILGKVAEDVTERGNLVGYQSGNTYGLALDSVFGYTHMAHGINYDDMLKFLEDDLTQ